MFSKIKCSVSGHKISKSRVWHDQINLRTNCVRCGVPMIRTMSGWRAYNETTDFNKDRLSAPPSRIHEGS